MAIVDVKTNLPNLQGLSTDERPAAENGTTLHIVAGENAGEVYIRHDGAWIKDLRAARAIKDAASL